MGQGRSRPAGTMEGWMDVARLPSWPHSETNVYLCGPVPHLHREVFGPEMLDYLL